MDGEFGADAPPVAAGAQARSDPSRDAGDDLLRAGSMRGVPTNPTRLRGFRAPAHDQTEPTPTDQGTSAAPKKNSRKWILVGTTTTAVASVAVVVLAILSFRLGANSSRADGRISAATSATSSGASSTLAVTDVYRQVLPSVVVITTNKGSLGTGFVVTDTGTILTADHVISDGGAVTVTFADGTKTSATVAGADKSIDIATLTPAKLPEVVVPAVLGGGITVGSDVVAMGNPLGLADSTTSGVVSGLNRTNKTDKGTLTGLIQFDAAVNPGSSGGPLLDNQGSVVGVVVSIADPGNDDSWSGIGFAVPIGAALGNTGTGSGRGPQL